MSEQPVLLTASYPFRRPEHKPHIPGRLKTNFNEVKTNLKLKS
ncbi:hypothetical protein NEISUBOT_05259 [Neisseria subflava NJ9703]|uniref:Uncharacterized protein n=1 Tax=Neisseria subflava NJ9703 TaxID=546268 RepID=A0A9W5MYM2_NEISU|nr:hypothetical protein NEISUBOT_05259 [Neisseria subflava NJ9703]